MKDLFDLLNKNIDYYIDSATLLKVVYNKTIKKNLKNLNICIEDNEEFNFLSLRNELNELGYHIENLEGGYEILDKKDKIVVKILVVVDAGKSRKYKHNSIRELFPNHYHFTTDLYNLKYYKYENMLLKGPKNPYPYIQRAYLKN